MVGVPWEKISAAERVQRFWEKVDKSAGPSGCWLWTATKSRGYGYFWTGERMEQAHVVSFRLAYGAIRGGLHVLHDCIAQRACVNPEHLRLGTNQDNVNDKVAQGRQVHLRGPKNGCAILSEADVREVVAAVRAGATHKATSKRFGVSENTVQSIMAGRNWRHLGLV